jgi:hypothetical protein
MPQIRPRNYVFAFGGLILAATVIAAAAVSEVRRFPLDSLKNLVTQSGVELDKQDSSDGHGSLRINSAGTSTVRLFEVESPGIENARLIYQARIKTRELQGKAYLEMWCRFPGKGEFFSRALNQTYGGSTEWSTTETPFFLQAGQNPDLVRLNLVVEGAGTVWIDDIRLLKAPLQ